MQLRLLGTLEVNLGGKPVADALSKKAQAILVYLGVTGRPQSRTVLATLLWGDMPESSARANLRKALADLRRELAPTLQIERQSVAFAPDIDPWVDAVEFEALINAASSPVDTEQLQTAVDLYQGDFLTGFYVRNAPEFEAWMLSEQARLRELMIQGLHTLTTYFAEHGDLSQGIAAARRLLNLEPWREEAHRQLMLLLAQDGQRGAALAQFEVCREMLAEELGVEPGRETAVLYERIRDDALVTDVGTGVERPEPEVEAAAQTPHKNYELPAPATSFVGRVQELDEIRQLLLDEPGCRMVSLVGTGGVGKTRLALAIASEIADAFPQGVCFVPLVKVSGTEFMVSAVAEALNFNFSGGMDPKAQLLNHLRDKKLLLVLDNFEHLLPTAFSTSEDELKKETPAAAAENGVELLSDILAAAPEVTLLVTSRERLKLQEEWGYDVQGMDYPSREVGEQTARAEQQLSVANYQRYSAIHLFVQRARRADASFRLDAEDIPHVVRVCQLVAGSPLGLELAAPWVRLMTCREIAHEIEHNLDLLTTTIRNVPDRHRSLRAVLAQTWQRLPQAEQVVLSRLSVFRGGCVREAAEQVAGASLAVLASLVDKAMLRRTHNGRYELHELVRQFAGGQLQTAPEEYRRLRDLHAGFYASFLQQRETDLKGRRQQEGLEAIRAELDNVRASWHWFIERKNVAALRQSLNSLFLFYEMRGMAQEGESAFRRAAAALDQPGETLDTAQTIALGQLLGHQGNLAIRTGRYDEGIALMRRGMLLLRQVEAEAKRELASVLCYLGEEIYFQGDYQQAQQLLQESLELATKVDDTWLLGVVRQSLGQTAEFQGDYREAEPHFRNSLDAFEKLGERRIKSFAQNNWGRVAYATGLYAQAEQLLNAALQVREALQDKVGIAYSCLDLGKLALMRGEYEAARKQTERGLQICEAIGERDLMARFLNGLGAASRLLGDYVRAEAEHQQSLSIYYEIGVKREIPFTLNNLGQVALDQGNYQRAEERFREALRLSQDLQNKTEMASAWRCLGHLATARERDEEARQNYRQSLDIVTKTGEAPVALDIFVGWADLLRRNNPVQAAELLIYVQQHTAVTHETKEKARQRLQEMAPELPKDRRMKDQSWSVDWQTVADHFINNLSPRDWRRPTAVIHNLPQQPTPFVGRATELANVTRRLSDTDCRLLTLVGPGGIGKTRLAIQTGHIFYERRAQTGLFGDGILFVPLAAVSTSAGLVSAIAEAANFHFYSNVPPRQQLFDYLQGKELLLILDNFEHLLPEATLVSDMLATAPEIKVLATSTEVLNLQEEWVHPIEGLPYPKDGESVARQLNEYDAIRLFEQSARRIRVDFSLAHEAQAVVRICRLVEGLPLGIELAAAWLKVLPAEKIAREIERSIDFLATRQQNVRERHRSIRAVFEHSWQRLTQAERRVFKRLSVFRGSFDQAAAGQVAEASLHTLAVLVEKSLLHVTETARYQWHEMLRKFAAAKLAEDSPTALATRERHSAYYLDFLQAREAMLTGQEQQTAVAQIARENDNVHAAWLWTVNQGDLAAIAQTLTSYFNFYLISSRYHQGEQTFGRLLDHLRQSDDLRGHQQYDVVRARALIRRGTFCYFLGDYERSNQYIEEGLQAELAPEQQSDVAFAYLVLGVVAGWQGKKELAEKWLHRSLSLSREIDDKENLADALHELAQLHGSFGNYAEAKRLAQESLAISRTHGRPDWVAHALSSLGWATVCVGEYADAARCFEEALAIFETIGSRHGVASAAGNLGWIAWCQGGEKLESAGSYLRESLNGARQIGHRLLISNFLGDLALLANETGEYEQAQEYSREGLQLAEEIGSAIYTSYHLCCLGGAAGGLGDYGEGRRYLLEALQIANDVQLVPKINLILLNFAILLLKESEASDSDLPASQQMKIQALELLALIIHHPVTWQGVRDRAKRLQAQLEAELPTDVVATAVTQGQNKTVDNVIETLLKNGHRK